MENREQAKESSDSQASQWDMGDVKFAGDNPDEEHDSEKEKPPKFLYRGITVPIETFSNLDLDGDLVPDKPPLIDKYGRETVGDGNEYGVYMTDNEQMAQDAYGNPYHNAHKGKEIGTIKPTFGDILKINEPYLGVIYKIDTEDTDIHRPWISAIFNGHYNNNYHGGEWVSLRIPKDSYEISKITIGEDFLHDEEDCTGKTKEEIEQRYDERVQHMERMCADLSQHMSKDLNFLTSKELQSRLKELYGDDGSIYQEEDGVESE